MDLTSQPSHPVRPALVTNGLTDRTSARISGPALSSGTTVSRLPAPVPEGDRERHMKSCSKSRILLLHHARRRNCSGKKKMKKWDPLGRGEGHCSTAALQPRANRRKIGDEGGRQCRWSNLGSSGWRGGRQTHVVIGGGDDQDPFRKRKKEKRKKENNQTPPEHRA
jgi:hypothetical protein